MPVDFFGWDKVGTGKHANTNCSTFKAWTWDAKALGINGSGLKITEFRNQEIKNFLDGTRKIRRGNTSPRVVNYHQITVDWKFTNHELVQLVEEKAKFHQGNPFKIKIWQADYPNLGVGGSDVYDAARLFPATPSAATCGLWVFPYRGISNDSGELPQIYANGTLLTTGYTVDYTNGMVLFTTPRNATDIVRSYFIWAPQVIVTETNPGPISGRAFRDNKYDLSITMEQV